MEVNVYGENYIYLSGNRSWKDSDLELHRITFIVTVFFKFDIQKNKKLINNFWQTIKIGTETFTN